MINSNRINIAVIGAGKMVQGVHLPLIKKLKDLGYYNLSLICDINCSLAKQSAYHYKFNNFTANAENVFSDDKINAVYIFGTTEMHYEYSLKALSAGKHVFIEKPPAPTWKRCLEIEKLAQKNNLTCVVGFNRRFQSNIQLAKNTLSKISKIQSMEAVYHQAVLDIDIPYHATSWLQAAGIHALDSLCYFMDDLPSEIFSICDPINYQKSQNFSTVLKWPSGAHATLTMNNTSGTRQERYFIHGLAASFLCDGISLSRYINNSVQLKKFPYTYLNRGYEGEHLEFISAIRNKYKPIHDIHHGVTALHLVELIETGFTGKISWNSIFQNHNIDSPKEIQSNHPQLIHSKKDGILILNSNMIKNQLLKIEKKYDLFFYERYNFLSQDEKNRIIALITGYGGQPMETHLLNELVSLKVVGIVGASVKAYHPELLLKKNIPIINVPEAIAEAVAEFALMMAILGITGALTAHENMRKGRWNHSGIYSDIIQWIKKIIKTTPLADIIKPWYIRLNERKYSSRNLSITSGPRNLQGASIGLIGYGACSRKFIDLLKVFNCKIRIFSDHLSSDEASQLGLEKTELAKVLSSQIVSIHRGFTDKTERSIGEIELNILKPGTVLINTARGGIIDTKALLMLGPILHLERISSILKSLYLILTGIFTESF